MGYGEAKAPVAADLTARLVVDLIGPQLLGQEALAIRALWDQLYASMRLRGHSRGFWLEALSGVDIALWDLAGQVLGQPVFKLLGGPFQTQIPVYASGIPPLPAGAASDRQALVRETAAQFAREGFKLIKVGAGQGLAADVATVDLVLEGCGKDAAVCVDAVGQYDRNGAAALAARLLERNVAWFEGPLVPEDLAGYAELARNSDLPIAYYVMFTHRDLRELLHHGGVDIIQPDVCRCGGITEGLRIAELADDFNLGFSLHGSVGSVISLAAAAHLAAAVPNLRAVEYWTDRTPLVTELATNHTEPRAGLLTVSEAPGLGLTINTDVLDQVAQARYGLE